MTPPSPTTGTPVPDVFTLDEAAGILRVKKSWLEKRAAARRIPFLMLGGSYHFSAAQLWQIVRDAEAAPAARVERRQEPTPAIRRTRRESLESADPRIVPLRPRSRRSPQRNQAAA